MNENNEDRMKKLLQQALPPVEEEPAPGRSLWPAVFRRLDAKPAPPPLRIEGWFDWALLAALVAFVAYLPESIPVFLYYL
jgi:hypothetical protein